MRRRWRMQRGAIYGDVRRRRNTTWRRCRSPPSRSCALWTTGRRRRGAFSSPQRRCCFYRVDGGCYRATSRDEPSRSSTKAPTPVMCLPSQLRYVLPSTVVWSMSESCAACARGIGQTTLLQVGTPNPFLRVAAFPEVSPSFVSFLRPPNSPITWILAHNLVEEPTLKSTSS